MNMIFKKNWIIVVLLLLTIGNTYAQDCIPCNHSTTEFDYDPPNNSVPCNFGPNPAEAIVIVSLAPRNGGDPGTAIYNTSTRKIAIIWNSAYSGIVDVNLLLEVRQLGSGGCQPLLLAVPHIRAFEKEPSSHSSINSVLNNTDPSHEVVRGQDAHFTWDLFDCYSDGSADIYLDNAGSSFGSDSEKNFTYNTSSLSSGQHQFQIKFTNTCNNSNSGASGFVTVVPTCYQDDLSAIESGSSVSGNFAVDGVVEGGYPYGGYELVKGQTYTINLAGFNQFADNYHLVFSPGLQQLSTNTFKVADNQTIGSYRVSIEKNTNNDPDGRCPGPDPFRVFLGGRDYKFTEDCIITLPDYLFNPAPKIPGVTDPNDIIFRHFNYTFESDQGVIVQSGIVLTEGARMRIVDNSHLVAGNDADLDRNFSEMTVFDDKGNVIGSSRIYADGMGRSTQVQRKNLSSGVILAAQTFYDREGHATLQTLAAPVQARTGTTNTCGTTAYAWENLPYEYKPNFFTYNSTVYNHRNFDVTRVSNADVSKIGNPDPADNTTPGTLGWYYSNNNNSASSSPFKEPLTDRTNYPFSQSEYYKDGTFEMKTAVGPGDVYRNTVGGGHQHISTMLTQPMPANDPDLEGWLTMRAEVFSSSPVLADIEDQFYRTKNTDENGRISYTILDKSGHAIISSYEETPRTVSYNFYDDAGKLRCSVTPNGVAAYTGSNYASLDKTTYEYNGRGLLSAINESDAGRTEYKYRRDGTLRFSQDAVQRAASPERFSYTNYDAYVRPIESGEYTASGSITWASINSTILESIATDGGLTGGTKTEQTFTYYDGENGSNTAPFTQEFVIGAVSCTQKANTSTSWYSYDERARLTKDVVFLHSLNRTFITEYVYGAADNITQVNFQPGQTDAFYHAYEYDADLNLTKVYAGPGTTTATDPDDKLLSNGKYIPLHANYSYYLHGPLKREVLGSASDQLQGEDFIYTIDGSLKAFNNPSNLADGTAGFAQDAYAFSIDYYAGDYTKTGTGIHSLSYGSGSADHFDGMIKGLNWKQRGEVASSARFDYNNRYELQNSLYGMPDFTTNTHTSSGYSEQGMSYDANGNLLGLLRINASGSTLHDFLNKYQYTTGHNKLNELTGYAQYQYDPAGRMTVADYTTGLDLYLNYTVSDKVKEAFQDASRTQPQVSFAYDEGDSRIMKRAYHSTSDEETWYIHSGSGSLMAIYKREIDKTNGSEISFEQVEMPIQGIARVGNVVRNPSNNTYSYIYELTDHTGSVRSTFLREKASGQADVLDWVDYYAYGFVMHRKPVSSFTYRYDYQGQHAEKDEETGFNAFELRMYDPVIGRWIGPDPANQYYSSYKAMGNNPVSNVDPDGSYSQAGAFVRSLFGGGGKIHQGNDGEWGYNTTKTFTEINDFGQTTSGVEILFHTGTPKYRSLNVEYANAYGGIDPMRLERIHANWKELSHGRLDYAPVDPTDLLIPELAASKVAIGVLMTDRRIVPTIVGEGMKRVRTEALKHSGSVFLNKMPKFTGARHQVINQMMAYNRQWLLQQMRSGRPIKDMGLDPTRGVPSIFYQMEQNMMKNYLKLHPEAFQIIK